jgi:hypothetical protein
MKGRRKNGVKRVRLLFADEGAYHRETLTLPSESLDRYERLIDCLREDPDVLARVHVDVGRLCAAYLVENEEES